MPNLVRRAALRAACALPLALAASTAGSQAPGAAASGAATSGTFPARPVRIIVPQAPGGASDTLARVIAAKLSERWNGASVVVENRPGAGGNVGTEAVARSAPDGYTLLLGYVGTHAINPALYAKLSWDPTRDFATVATLATVPFALVINPSMPAASVGEFVDAARRAPEALMYASAGNGSVNHLLGEMFNAAASVRMVHVPYKGAGTALTDLIGGQVHATFTSVASAAQYVKRGQLRALAITSARRSASFPEVPTLAEGGIKGFDVNPWFGLLAPGGTPRELVQRINADVNTLLATAEVRDKFAAVGAEPLATTPERFGDMLRDDLAKWGKVVRDSGAKVD